MTEDCNSVAEGDVASITLMHSVREKNGNDDVELSNDSCEDFGYDGEFLGGCRRHSCVGELTCRRRRLSTTCRCII